MPGFHGSFSITVHRARRRSLTVSPANPTASSGVPFTVDARWSGLDPSAPYLGLLSYVDDSGTLAEIN